MSSFCIIIIIIICIHFVFFYFTFALHSVEHFITFCLLAITWKTFASFQYGIVKQSSLSCLHNDILKTRMLTVTHNTITNGLSGEKEANIQNKRMMILTFSNVQVLFVF